MSLKLGPFGFLNSTQFLGAMNDNIFKLLTVFCFIAVEGKAASNSILASVGALYVMPFLLLSSTAGTMADRFSKKTIIVGVKIAECLVMILGAIGFYTGSKFLAYGSLFLLACHSAIFAPCKFGIVPEIVPQDRISKVNGILTFSTYAAIILGTFLAAFLTDITGHNFIVAASFSIGFAVIGFLTSLKIPKTLPAGSKREITPWFLSELFRNLKLTYKEPSLLSAVLGSAFFLFVGSYIQLNMIPFAIHTLHLTDVQGGYLFLCTALGIGMGALLAGKLSGKRVELGLVPLGGIGIAVSAILISMVSHSLVLEIFLITLIGVFAGLYLVPLDSYIQMASPKTMRGQVIATTNFLGFFGVLLSAGLLYFLSEILGLPPEEGFLVVGILALTFVICISIAIAGYFVRYFCMVSSRFYYRGIVHNPPNDSSPAIYLSTLPPDPWAIFLTAVQLRRLRVFIVSEHSTTPLLDRLFLRHKIGSLEELAPDQPMGKLLRHSLERSTSIAIFLPPSYDPLAYKGTWQKDAQQSLPYLLYMQKEGTSLYEAQLVTL